MTYFLPVTNLIVNEADGYAEFVVRLSAPATSTITVNYDTVERTADDYSSSDYSYTSGTLSFAPGVTTQTVRVPLTNDVTAENTESFVLRLSSAKDASGTAVTIANNTATATIIDNDTVVSDTNGNGMLDEGEKAALSVRDVVVDEKAGIATFDLILNKAASSAFSVAYSTADGSTSAGSDYTAASGSVTFAAGQTSQRVSITILDDLLAEGNEYFHLVLGAITGTTEVVVADGVGTAVIGGNDQLAVALPTIISSDIVVNEADGYAEFVVRLSAPATSTITVNYDTVERTADDYSSSDYSYTSGTLSFAPGVTTQTVRVPLTNDVTAENTESFVLRLSSAKDASGTAVTIANNTATATIIDNDTVVSDTNGNGMLDEGEKAALSVRDVVVDEKAGIATFDLILNKAASSAFSVAYSTADGSTSAGSDYTAASGSVTFAAGQTSQRVSITILDDLLAEGNEYFHLVLGAITGTTEVVVADGVGTAVIGGNDQLAVALPTIISSDIVVNEADGYAEFVVRLSAPATSTITVNYDTVERTADDYSSSDYSYTSGTLSFAPGVTTQTVRVPLTNDVTAENTESFVLRLSSAKDASGTAVTIANNTATATIIDNDTVVSDTNGNGMLDEGEKAALSVRDVVVDEKAGIATFDLILNKAASSAFSVAYSTADGSTSAGSDYTAASGSVTFAAGQTSQRVSITILDDLLAEGNEYFHLVLGAITGTTEVVVADGVGTAVIGGNDQLAVALPTIISSDIVVNEADGYAEFVVRLSAPATSTITVNYDTVERTADDYSSNDYSSTYGTLSFAPGVTTQTVRVPLTEDVDVESSESFVLRLWGAKNASGNEVTIANNFATAILIDNDTKVSDTNGNGMLDEGEKAALSVRDVVVDEKAGIATFDLILNKAASSAFSVAYSTADGSTSAGSDYTAASGSVTFAAGQTSQRVSITILDDLLAEGNEYFHLVLGAITGTTEVVVADGVGTAVIGGNDQLAVALPTIISSDIVVNEADGYAEFVVRLSAPATSTITVNYDTVERTADDYSSNDYSSTYGTLSFAPGVTTQTVRVPLTNDVTAENTESFELRFTNARNASGTAVPIANNVVTATIMDDDSGFEILNYGLGDDIYTITHGNQYIVETPDGGIDWVESSINYSLGDTDGPGMLGSFVENLALTGSAVTGIGNALSNILVGNAFNNQLHGMEGDDMLAGGAGNDVLNGGSGIDTAYYFGTAAQYSIRFDRATGTASVSDTQIQRDGADTLNGIERVAFADLSLNLSVRGVASTIPQAGLNRIAELYVAFFNRMPDGDGMQFWIETFKSGQSINQIAEAFYNAGVYFSDITGYRADMTNEDFIHIVYRNVLGRSEGADAGGLNFWSAELTSGRSSKGALVSSILDAAHGVAFSDPGNPFHWVQKLLDNKLEVARQVSVEWGVNYNSSQDSISKGMAIAAAITPDDISAAIALVGVVDAVMM